MLTRMVRNWPLLALCTMALEATSDAITMASSATAHAGLAGPVSLADHDDGPAAIYADAFALGQVTKDADTVARARELIELVRCEALPRAASLELIRETTEERWKLT
jgi:hypothetical protein